MARNSIGLAPAIYLVAASALWGIATVISKDLLSSVPAITLLVGVLAARAEPQDCFGGIN